MEEQINQIIEVLAGQDEKAQQLAAQLIQAVQQQDESAIQVAQTVQQKAEAGDPTAQAAMQNIATVAQAMQDAAKGGQPQQAQPAAPTMARLGAKLNYINYLRGKCPDGFEMQIFRKGGAVCKKCVKKCKEGDNMGQINMASSGNKVIDEFRCGRKMKAKKAACGTKAKMPMDKCGGKAKKKTNKCK